MNLILIDKIEGNSGIGVPVFSKFGKNSNYNYKVFSPGQPFQAPENDEYQKSLNSDFDKFRYKRPTPDDEQPKIEVAVNNSINTRITTPKKPKVKQREHAVF